jgi:anaerobic ribonucleoside-triphosphate reductase
MMRWYCLDCEQVGELTRHGVCATCGSQAVALAESLRPALQPVDWVERAIEDAAKER